MKTNENGHITGKCVSRMFKPSINVLSKSEGRKEMFYLTTYLTHFTYGYMASDIW